MNNKRYVRWRLEVIIEILNTDQKTDEMWWAYGVDVAL